MLPFFSITIGLAILIFGMIMLCIWLEQYITIVGSILLGIVGVYYIAYGAVYVADKLGDRFIK